jgi:hypothetical protein
MGMAWSTLWGSRWIRTGFLVANSEGKKLLGRLRSRWEDNIKMDIKVIVWASMDCIDLVKDRDCTEAIVKAVTKFVS